MTKEQFKASELFTIYDGWAKSVIANDFYTPWQYDEEGEVVNEAEFDTNGLNNACEKNLDWAIEIFPIFQIYAETPSKIKEDSETDKENKKRIKLILSKSMCYPQCIYGAIYCIGLLSIHTRKKLNFGYVIRQNYEIIINDEFKKIGSLHEWLELYCKVRRVSKTWLIPIQFRECPTCIKYLNLLYEKSYLDENYKPVNTLGIQQKTGLAKNIYNSVFPNQDRIEWAIFESWWGMKNMKINYQRFRNNNNYNEFYHSITDILNSI